MPNFTYDNTQPVATDLPSVSQPLMVTNCASIASILGGNSLVDMIGFGDDDGGYHRHITLVQQASDPAVVADTAQVYSKSLTTGALTQPEIYVRHPTGSPILLTRGLPTASSGEGVAYSGMQIRAGTGTGGIAVTFSTPFNTAIISVVITPTQTNGAPGRVVTQSVTGFTTPGPGGTFNWIAIGY